MRRCEPSTMNVLNRKRPFALLTLFVVAGSRCRAEELLDLTRAERQRVLDVLRGPVARELNQKVVFKVNRFRARDGWAFLMGKPQQPGGKAVNYRLTRYAGAMREGMFDDGICALLRKTKGRWQIVTYVIGATDVVYEDWDKRYKAPAALFRLSNRAAD